MKRNIDLTTDSRFSSNRRGSFRFNDISLSFFTNSRFHLSIKVPRWIDNCISKSSRYFKDFGFGIFEMRLHNPNMDIELFQNGLCPCCGKTKVPWKEFCRKCARNNGMSDLERESWNRWPYEKRDVMKSNTRILNL